MYSMTGRWAGQGTEAGVAGEAAAPSGLWARVRRRFGRDPGPQHPAGPGRADDPGAAAGDGETTAGPPPDALVPRWLQTAAGWSWRLLIVALLIYVTFRLTVQLRLVVLPFIAALLLTALLEPLTSRLKRGGMTPMLATWCTFLLAIILIAGAVFLFADRVSADYATLSAEVTKTARQVQHSLAGPPFHLNARRLQTYTDDLVNYLSEHKAQIASTVLAGGKYALELLAGLILMLFISFFLLKDGSKIWAWLIKGLGPEPRRRVDLAGETAWRTLVAYVRGTTLVGAIHALFIGLALWLLGVPLLVPFIVLVFLASYLPLIGILVVGALAILVALATKGWVAAVILLAVLLVENQIESHLLQPLVVGRLVRLHPLSIILVLAVGGIIAGIPGAIVAVPFTAVITYAWPVLRAGRRAG
jgi:predicted PurR-regulated permease PerM